MQVTPPRPKIVVTGGGAGDRELVGEALDLGRFGDSIVGCLDDLAPHLPADRLAEVLAEVAAHDPYSRACGLTALAPHLPDVLLPDALALARDIDDLPTAADYHRRWSPHPLSDGSMAGWRRRSSRPRCPPAPAWTTSWPRSRTSAGAVMPSGCVRSWAR